MFVEGKCNYQDIEKCMMLDVRFLDHSIIIHLTSSITHLFWSFFTFWSRRINRFIIRYVGIIQ